MAINFDCKDQQGVNVTDKKLCDYLTEQSVWMKEVQAVLERCCAEAKGKKTGIEAMAAGGTRPPRDPPVFPPL